MSERSATRTEINRVLEIHKNRFQGDIPASNLRQRNIHQKVPIPGEKNILITSALPYVNNIPHLGNIIGCVLSADCFNRIAQDIFLKIYKSNLFQEITINQLFCQNCNRFVEGTCPSCSYIDARGDQCDACGKLIDATELINPSCKICRSKPVVKESTHLYFELNKIQPKIENWVSKSQETGKWSQNAISITRSWLKEGLNPRCVTRDLKWGTPIPIDGFRDKVFYIWFEAPIGYISITAEYLRDHWKEWWIQEDTLDDDSPKKNVKLVQFMAKDNIPFHTIIFPGSLMVTGDNFNLLNDISCTEYLNYENEKFSKSRGLGVFGDNAKDSGIPADIFRFYLLSNRPESQDTSFTWVDLLAKANGDLLNNLGNFINRTLKFIKCNYNGIVPEYSLNNDEAEFIVFINKILKDYTESMEAYRIRDGAKYLLEVSRQRSKNICCINFNVTVLIGIMINPYMPEISRKIFDQTKLSFDEMTLPENFELSFVNHEIGNPEPLFQRYPSNLAAELKEKYAGKHDIISGEKINGLSQQDIDLINSIPIANLKIEVEKKGNEIRELKAKKSTKIEIARHVAQLNALKKRLK